MNRCFLILHGHEISENIKYKSKYKNYYIMAQIMSVTGCHKSASSVIDYQHVSNKEKQCINGKILIKDDCFINVKKNSKTKENVSRSP